MELVNYIDKYGKKRKGLEKTCPNCEQNFYHRPDINKNCCSEKCKQELTKKLQLAYVELKCDSCFKLFKRRKSNLNNSRSGFRFCSRECKEFAQSLKGGLKEIQPSHYGTADIKYRHLFTEEELVCARCGYDEWKSCVDIHHIDENRENNDKSNLIPLCCNCHHGLHRGCWKFEELKMVQSNSG